MPGSRRKKWKTTYMLISFPLSTILELFRQHIIIIIIFCILLHSWWYIRNKNVAWSMLGFLFYLGLVHLTVNVNNMCFQGFDESGVKHKYPHPRISCISKRFTSIFFFFFSSLRSVSVQGVLYNNTRCSPAICVCVKFHFFLKGDPGGSMS